MNDKPELRIASDLHNEFGFPGLETSPADRERILVLAGDIGKSRKPATFRDFFRQASESFLHVVYVIGNHEYYDDSFVLALGRLRDALACHANVTILERETLQLGSYTFYGTTLWTDLDRRDPLAVLRARDEIRDYRYIRSGTARSPHQRRLGPAETVNEQSKSVAWLEQELAREKTGPRIIVTHHAPSRRSAPEQTPLTPAYCNDLDEFVARCGAELWIHGHTHTSCDYTLGATRVLCNPYGYHLVRSALCEHSERNADFDPQLIVQP